MQTWRLAVACDDEDALGGQPMHTLCYGRVQPGRHTCGQHLSRVLQASPIRVIEPTCRGQKPFSLAAHLLVHTSKYLMPVELVQERRMADLIVPVSLDWNGKSWNGQRSPNHLQRVPRPPQKAHLEENDEGAAPRHIGDESKQSIHSR